MQNAAQFYFSPPPGRSLNTIKKIEGLSLVDTAFDRLSASPTFLPALLGVLGLAFLCLVLLSLGFLGDLKLFRFVRLFECLLSTRANCTRGRKKRGEQEGNVLQEGTTHKKAHLGPKNLPVNMRRRLSEILQTLHPDEPNYGGYALIMRERNTMYLEQLPLRICLSGLTVRLEFCPRRNPLTLFFIREDLNVPRVINFWKLK